jgi:hypothetical protein
MSTLRVQPLHGNDGTDRGATLIAFHQQFAAEIAKALGHSADSNTVLKEFIGHHAIEPCECANPMDRKVH